MERYEVVTLEGMEEEPLIEVEEEARGQLPGRGLLSERLPLLDPSNQDSPRLQDELSALCSQNFTLVRPPMQDGALGTWGALVHGDPCPSPWLKWLWLVVTLAILAFFFIESWVHSGVEYQ